MRVLVLGIGNTLLSDDGVGIRVAREIGRRVEGVNVAEANTVGMPLLDRVSGYDRVIFIDSTSSEDVPVGTVREFDLTQIQKSHPFLSHGVNLPLTIEFGRRCGEDVPREMKVYGIGVKDTKTFGESCTTEVESAIPEIADQIITKEFSDLTVKDWSS